jgi:hypothetical protein
MAASTIPPLSVWPCGTPFGNTQEGADRLGSAQITAQITPRQRKRETQPLGPPHLPKRRCGSTASQTDPLTPWYNGQAGIHFKYSPGLLGGKGTSARHPRGKNYGDRTPPGASFSPWGDALFSEQGLAFEFSVQRLSQRLEFKV